MKRKFGKVLILRCAGSSGSRKSYTSVVAEYVKCKVRANQDIKQEHYTPD